MKKNLIIFLLVIFIFSSLQPKLAFGQLPGLPGVSEYVPVIDENAVGALGRINEVLDSILSLTSNELLRLNQTLAEILRTNFEEQANKIFTDSLKEEEYQEYLTTLSKFIQERKKMAEDPEVAGALITEASKAGAYEGLLEFAENIPCLDPEIRTDLTDAILDMTTEFHLTEKTLEVLNQIPDCAIESSSITYYKPKLSFFSWLVQPFQLNLAQVSQSNVDISLPEISIEPAFLDTERSIQLSDLIFSANSLISNRAQQSAKKMETMIGDTMPIMECAQPSFEFDGKEFVCLRYRTLISGDDLKITVNNPLVHTIQDINVYQKFANNSDVLRKLKLTTSSVASSSDLIGTFTDEKEAKAIIDRVCGSNTSTNASQAPTATPAVAYPICLQEINKKLEKYTQIQEKKIRELINYASTTQEAMQQIRDRAETVRQNLNDHCSSTAYQAIEDLDSLINELGSTIGLYNGAINGMLNNYNEINNIRQEIISLSNGINESINNIFQQPKQVLSILDELLGMKIFESILPLPGGSYASKINFFKNKLGEIQDKISNRIEQIVRDIDENLTSLANIVSQVNNLIYQLNQTNFSRSDILNDNYKLRLILQKIQAYQMLQSTCSSTSPSPIQTTFLNKKHLITINDKIQDKKIENKNLKLKPINFLALIKKLWQPKLVEISNEK